VYNAFCQFCERLLRIPPDPEPPPGDQASTRQFRAAPNFYKYLLFIWGLKSFFTLIAAAWFTAIPIAIALSLGRRHHGYAWLLFLIPLVIVPALILLRLFALAVLQLDFDKRWYLVTDRSLRVREGVLTVREMTITFANIQNISVSQGPVQRALGVADLRVDTAGGSTINEAKNPGANLHTAWLRGINNTEEVRDLIQERLRRLKDAGLGDQDDSQHDLSVRQKSAPRAAVLAALREVHTETVALRRAIAPSTR
jgi:uncharacterized membrane protein YdbT with pleckstrin-like domain